MSYAAALPLILLRTQLPALNLALYIPDSSCLAPSVLPILETEGVSPLSYLSFLICSCTCSLFSTYSGTIQYIVLPILETEGLVLYLLRYRYFVAGRIVAELQQVMSPAL